MQTDIRSTSEDFAVWRYVDMPRFVSMLHRQTLWFAKASTFEDDPHEAFCQAMHSWQDGCGTAAQQLVGWGGKQTAEIFEDARNCLYVNSWFISEFESNLMWKTYSSLETGMAIKSSVCRLATAIRLGEVRPAQFRMDFVQYHEDLRNVNALKFDFSSGFPLGDEMIRQILSIAFHKRNQFGAEREWRAAIYQDPTPPDQRGAELAVDLDELLWDIVAAPKCPDYFLEGLESLCARFGLRMKPRRSTLLDRPRRT